MEIDFGFNVSVELNDEKAVLKNDGLEVDLWKL